MWCPAWKFKSQHMGEAFRSDHVQTAVCVYSKRMEEWWNIVTSAMTVCQTGCNRKCAVKHVAENFFFLFLPMPPPHVLMNFRGFPPGCGDSVADFWGLGRPWGMTTLSRLCEWWYAGRWNTRRGLKPKSTNYPDNGHHGNLSLSLVERGIEPGTSWLVVRDPDH